MTDELVLCGVDGTEAGTTVMTAAKATGAPVLLVHISNDLWGRKSRRSSRTLKRTGSWTMARSARGCCGSPSPARPA